MKITQSKADSLAVGISLFCSVHCLTMPLLVVAMPMLSGLFFAEESFHLWMVIGVLPISAYALMAGQKAHGDNMPMLVGAAGLFVLIVAALFGHDLVGEAGEKALTVLGSCAVAAGHIWNHRIGKSVAA